MVLAGCARDEPGSAAFGHFDGEAEGVVSVTVTDAWTQQPVEGVKVTYFNPAEFAQLRIYKAQELSGKSGDIAAPTGTVAYTNGAGQAQLGVRFDAAISIPDGKTYDATWGVLQYERAGYEGILEDFSNWAFVTGDGDDIGHEDVQKELRPLFRLTESGAFPEPLREPSSAVVVAVASFGADPNDFYAEVSQPQSSGQYVFFLRRSSTLQQVRESTTLGDPFGGSLSATYDVSSGRVTAISGVR